MKDGVCARISRPKGERDSANLAMDECIAIAPDE